MVNQFVSPKHSVSVAGVVVNDENSILAIKRADNGKWQIPGGVLELDESIQEGLKREIREETGVEVRVEGLTGVYKNMGLGVVALVFLCRPASGEERTSDESAEVVWLNLQQIEERFDLVFSTRVSDALSGQAHARNHDGRVFIVEELSQDIER